MTKVKRNQTLPSDVAEWLDILGQDDRNVYLQALRRRGWTLQSMANVTGISRERVRQIVASDWPDGMLSDSAPLPDPPERVERVASPRRSVDPAPDTLARLMELQPIVRRVVGNSRSGRAEAEEYAALLWHAHTFEGVTYYRLAKLLGVTHSAIRSRLVRYGYIETGLTYGTDGPTRAYKPILSRNRVGLSSTSGTCEISP